MEANISIITNKEHDTLTIIDEPTKRPPTPIMDNLTSKK